MDVYRRAILILSSFLILVVFAIGVYMHGTIPAAFAQTTDTTQVNQLQAQIDAKNKELQKLQDEIKEVQSQLNTVGSKKKDLQNTILELDLSRRKLLGDIAVTQNRMSTANTQIKQLSYSISELETKQTKQRTAIASMLAQVNTLDDKSALETLMNGRNMTDYWVQADTIGEFNNGLRTNIISLGLVENNLSKTKQSQEQVEHSLEMLQQNLDGQKTALDQTRVQKNQLLVQTKNQESSYQKLLADKKKAAQKTEGDIKDYESQIKFILNPSTIPTAGNAVFAMPFSSAYMAGCQSLLKALGNPDCITQYFGNTSFAQSGAYNGKGHNGVDFSAPIGTPVHAVLNGTVMATGNTDLVAGCYSYGKWVLVKHNNGLTTLYAHFSSIAVSQGQTVTTGQTLGYSGATGYVTGPHLHLTVFASAGVQVVRMGDVKTATNCGAAYVPVAGTQAYLNPLDYLLAR